jgi:predicted RNA-binding Zn-ribbon protein involved in translation (DUF1610 family)
MTTLLLEEVAAPVRAADQIDRSAPRPICTLDALLTATWTQLGLRGHATCPACGGRMEARLAATSRAGAVGTCAGCGSELS